MARPIQKRLLIHSVEITPYTVEDNIDNYDTTKTIENVRVEPTSKTILDLQGNSIDISNLLFVDAVHSTPFNADDYVVNSVVKFDGKTLVVKAVDKLYTTKLHHLEVMLA